MNTLEFLTLEIKKATGAEDILPDQRFLDVGGNSLNLVKLLKAIKNETGVAMPAKAFFDKTRSTINQLSIELDILIKSNPS